MLEGIIWSSTVLRCIVSAETQVCPFFKWNANISPNIVAATQQLGLLLFAPAVVVKIKDAIYIILDPAVVAVGWSTFKINLSKWKIESFMGVKR